MTKKDIEGFFSNPFFVALKPEKFDSEYTESILKSTLKEQFVGNNNWFYQNLLDLFLTKFSNIEYYNEDYIPIIKQVVVNCLIEHNMLKYFCLNEEYDKAVGIISRKQFNSKLLNTIHNRIGYFFQTIKINESNLVLMLATDICREIEKYNSDYIMKKVAPLKTIVDKVASGVKSQCYLDFINRPNFGYISTELNNYIKEEYGYDLSTYEYYYDFPLKTKAVLSLAVINDESFWNFKQDEKTLFSFLGFVEKYNDIQHAKKIVDYAFAEACKNKDIKFLYGNKLPLYFCYDLEGKMAKQAANFFERRFGSVFGVELSSEEINGFVFPIYPGYNKNVELGKKKFIDFITNAYKNDAETIFNLFKDLSNVIQDQEVISRSVTRKQLCLREYLEFELLGWDLVKEKEEYLFKKYDNYESNESVLGRFYYRIYLIDKYAKEQSYEYIYEYIFPMLSMIDKKYGTTCSYALDTTFRDNYYKQLKGKLKKHNIDIDDKYKQLYIIALLDRKYATPDEADMFAELEQTGDAVYDLAIDNIIFYNPDKYEVLNHAIREEYVNADAQVIVSKKLGFDKLYISKLHDSFNNKYMDHEDIESGIHLLGEEHYIADSLEMIIGAITKEFGYQKALDFATEIILETYPQLHKPEFIENFDVMALYNSNYDRDYLEKIFPGPFSMEDSDYIEDYRTMSYALNKILKIAILGNDTKEKRIMIAHNADRVLPKQDIYDFYEYVVAYLYNGIEKVIEKYRPIVESSYSDYKE